MFHNSLELIRNLDQEIVYTDLRVTTCESVDRTEVTHSHNNQ